ncbi:LP14331p [Strongyloides ratti]|uniref:ABC-type xenobiotic transporter n=1 Tax=Strongyloides ratti TaxID=34506 RepID=A0A090KZQ3_STRRB|nr:LP14331p [Strongyloides ratti]CEF61347.1 LP14331p [Strongyloides ratti]
MGNRQGSQSENENDKNKEPEVKKVSLKKLYRYASKFDLLLLFIGCCVAIVTGCGFPFMSIIIGDISSAFINSMTLQSLNVSTDLNNCHNVVYHNIVFNYTWCQFRDDIMAKCYDYVYLGFAMFIAAFIQVLCFQISCENVNHIIKKKFLYATMRQNIAWYDKNSSGSLNTKMFDNLERVKEGTGDKMGLLVQFVAQFFGGYIIAFTYDWRLTLIMMALSPFMVICGFFLAKLMATAAKREAEKYAIAGTIAEESLSSIRTVTAFNGQQRECKRYELALLNAMKDGIKKGAVVGGGLGLTFLIIFASYCLAFWVGTDFIYDGKVESNVVFTVFFSVMMGSMALGQAGPQFAVLGTALGCASSLFEIIDREPEIDCYSEEGLKPSKINGIVEMEKVVFNYPSRPEIQVLKGISFKAEAGQKIALVGSSGCGKSTTVQLLLRYYQQLGGSIKIDGYNIEDLNIKYLRNIIGVVSQEPILFNCSIEDNIRYGNPNVTEEQIMHACRNANAENFIKSLPQGLKTLCGEGGSQFSGGQRQRIAIARALVRDPKILLLDEATSALDSESEAIVQKALEKASLNRTTIAIAHRLSTVRNSDLILVMKDGEICEKGKHDELLEKKGLYYELVNAQSFTDINPNESVEDKLRRERYISSSSTRSRSGSILSLKKDVKDLGDPSLFTKKDVDKDNKPDDKSELKRLQQELEAEGAGKSDLIEILKFAKPEWKFLFIGLLLSAIQGVIMPIFSQVFSQIMKVFSLTDREEMRKEGHIYAMMFLALGIFQGVTLSVSAFFFGLSSENLTARLRSLLFKNIIGREIGYFDDDIHSTGRLTTRLATDVPNIKNALDYRLGQVFSAIVSFGSGIGIAFYFGWQLALLLVAIFPLAGITQGFHFKYVSGRMNQDNEGNEEAGKVAMEAIENIRTVQALTLEKKLYSKFSEYLEYPHKTAKKKALLQAMIYGASSSIVIFVNAAAFRFGLWLILNNDIEPLNVMKCIFAFGFTAQSIGFASAYFPEYVKARLASGIVFKMLNEKPSIESLTDSGKKIDVEGNINLKKIYFSYPQRSSVRVLKGLDISIEKGKSLALVGPSGCGKSTCIGLLERFYDVLDGNVLIDGVDIRETNIQNIRSQIALVSQEPILFDCSIRENILYGLEDKEITDEEINKVIKESNIHEFIESLPDGLDTNCGSKGLSKLSGGQKQRIAIARALIRNPKILLLDEATSALDTESEKIVQEALDKACENRTVVIVAHRLTTVQNCDCIAVVNNGIVVEKGTHQELIKKRGIYYDLTERQNINK